METIGIGADQKDKPVLYFQNHTKGLVLNKTNKYVLMEAFGPETDHWLGKKIVLYAELTTFQGKPVKGLRVRVPTTQRVAVVKEEPTREGWTPPWEAGEPPPSIIIEAEAMARQGVGRLRDWRDHLSAEEAVKLKPEMDRLLAIARKATDKQTANG